MTEYKEEQIGEVEALEAIYADELEILETEPFHKFNVQVAVQNHDKNEENPIDVNVLVNFTYTEKYPDTAPLMEIVDSENLDDEQITILTDLLNDQAEENLGMVMVFTLVSAVQEKLNELVDRMKEERLEEEERKKQEAEEAELRRFDGTRVTIETFLAWKANFDLEMESLKKTEKVVSKRQTGRELFMNDSTLDDSDVKFLQENGDSVEVDESLFEELDDLDIED